MIDWMVFQRLTTFEAGTDERMCARYIWPLGLELKDAVMMGLYNPRFTE